MRSEKLVAGGRGSAVPEDVTTCLSCGEQLASDARFCDQCGSPVVAPVSFGEAKRLGEVDWSETEVASHEGPAQTPRFVPFASRKAFLKSRA